MDSFVDRILIQRIPALLERVSAPTLRIGVRTVTKLDMEWSGVIVWVSLEGPGGECWLVELTQKR